MHRANEDQYHKDVQVRLYHLLQSIKDEKGWTHKDLAIALNVSTSLIEKWCSHNVSSFVKNYFLLIKRLAETSGRSTSNLVAILDGSDTEDSFYSDLVKKVSTETTSFQLTIDQVLSCSGNEKSDIKEILSTYFALNQEQKKTVTQLFKMIKGAKS